MARNLYTVDDHVVWTHGIHQIEAGFWLQRIQSNDSLAQDQNGQASFSSLQTFLQGTIATFTVSIADRARLALAGSRGVCAGRH